MTKTIEELKNTWLKDKEAFKSKELGGLQRFVADILECPKLFNFKQGYESTPDKERKYEFTIEKNKNKRRADIVIFIKGIEIVIPVEVERYENIEEGVLQLANYQNDYQKSYGILTDGYSWRFYNNTIYKTFTLDDILENFDTFKIFWEDYIKEENYYLNFFEGADGQSLIEESLKVEENKELFFEDITNLIQKFKNKLDIVGYLQEKGTPDSNKKATEIAYAYFIQFILYKNLVDNCYSTFHEEFDKRMNNVYKGLKTELYRTVSLEVFSISGFISDKLYKPFSKEQEYINQKLNEVIRKPEVLLDEVTLWLDIIIFIKKYNFANMKNEIFGYIYENYLKELYSEENKGQYFTDPAVVNFMLDKIGYTTKNIQKLHKKGTLSIIDPSCGSGTFLYSAVDRIVTALFDGTEASAEAVEKIINDNVFGLDIEEFPLYLAEMNILMRMLPIIINKDYTNPIDKKIKVFKTQDSISEFMDAGISGQIDAGMDENTGQYSLFNPSLLELSYKSYIRDEDDLKEMKQSMRPPRRRFDFVVGNPPYIGYNECCKQKVLFTQLDNIHMDNIYGVNLNTVLGRKKSYSPKPNLFAFFIALGGGLLKSGGKLCYIIPQTILTAQDLDVLRYYLSSSITLEKILTFSGKLFIGRGIKGRNPIATSSLIFVINKRIPKDNSVVDVINYTKYNTTEIDSILNTRKDKITKKISQKELLDNIENWNFLTKTPSEIALSDEYIKNTISIEEYRNILPNYDFVQFDKGTVFDKKKITFDKKDWKIIKKTKGYIKLDTSGYIADNEIRYPEGSQGRNIFLNQYKIVWRYINPDGFYFSNDNIMIDFNYVIISSNDKREILMLLAILNSKVSEFIFYFYLKLANEKDLLCGIKPIKQFIRIPKITDNNKHLEEEIIKQTQKMLDLEDKKLSDFVDFSNITMQQFDSISFDDNSFILTKNNEKYKLKIKTHQKFSMIKDIFKNPKIKKTNISLTELKSISILDKEEQSKIKDYIDDLIFALYFGVPLNSLNYKVAIDVKEYCMKNEYYRLINPLS